MSNHVKNQVPTKRNNNVGTKNTKRVTVTIPTITETKRSRRLREKNRKIVQSVKSKNILTF